MNRELEDLDLDYELRVQSLAEPVSSQTSVQLYYASRNGDINTVKNLVDKTNCNPMLKVKRGATALHVAAYAGNLDVLKYFITENNCNPACPGSHGLTPLHLASEQGHLNVVKYLVTERQMDPLHEDENGNNSLHRACIGGNWAVVMFLTSEIDKYLHISELMSSLEQCSIKRSFRHREILYLESEL